MSTLNYPDGTANDPRAPWNQDPDPTAECWMCGAEIELDAFGELAEECPPCARDLRDPGLEEE